MIKADNQSDKHLTIAGLTVLGDVQSNNLSQLQKQVQNNFDKTQNLTAQQKDFWSELANDNIITAVEKKQLKQELAVITQTHTSIINLASEKGEQDNPLIMMYDAKYGDLLDYINKVKLFDEMAKSTNVDKTEFTRKFTEYYDSEIVAQSIFTGKTAATIRVLNSLFETGTINEVATYRGVFYKWNGKQWVLVNGNEYLGMFDHLPEADINDYFLCGIDFEENLTLKANGKSLLADGKILQVNCKFEKGYVYISTDKGWKKIENKSDYRYFLITNDLISIGEMSPGLENAISIGQPRYLGLFYELPTEYRKNDWFTYAGITTEYFIQGRVYKWNGEEWEEVTAESKNYQMLMTSLTDIINANPSEQGYFTAIFAQALIASNAFIQNLQSQIITLTQALNEDGTLNENTGIIQSSNYLQTNGQEGWQIRADGSADFKTGNFKNGKFDNCQIEYSNFSGSLKCGIFEVIPTIEDSEFSIQPYEKTETFKSDTLKYFESLINFSVGDTHGFGGRPVTDVIKDSGWALLSNFAPVGRKYASFVSSGSLGDLGGEKYWLRIISTTVDNTITVYASNGSRSLGGTQGIYRWAWESGNTGTGIMQASFWQYGQEMLSNVNAKGLPIEEPKNAGQLWRDGEYVKVSLGNNAPVSTINPTWP